MTEDQQEYLDDLYEQGIVNMFDAALHLVRDCNMTESAAFEALDEWMRTFSDRLTDIT